MKGYRIRNRFEDFFNITHMDTIYIASPNSLHFSQAKQAILAGKM